MSNWVKRILAVVLVCVLVGGAVPLSRIGARAEASFIPMITAGWNRSFAIKSDGTIWAWGGNGVNGGNLGNEDPTSGTFYAPVRAHILSDVIAVETAMQHSVALKSNGTVWTWGFNGNRELGDGTNLDSDTLVPVYGLNGITAITVGETHSLALKSDGTVWAWGPNFYGCAGYDPAEPRRNIPTQVQGLGGVTAIAAGESHSLALKNDGSVWAWGGNHYGQFGNGSGTDTTSYIPVQVPGLNGVTAIAAGDYFTLALKSDGTVWAWGSNAQGRLGDGTTYLQREPVKVQGLSGITAISSSKEFTLALKSDGTVWAWGYNRCYQLGTAGIATSNVPLQVQGLGGVTAIAAGAYHSLALKSDGTVWIWGDRGAGGQSGVDTSQHRSAPVQVQGPNGVGWLNLGESGGPGDDPGSNPTGDVIPFADVVWKDNYFSLDPTKYEISDSEHRLHQLATIAAKLSSDAYNESRVQNSLIALQFEKNEPNKPNRMKSVNYPAKMDEQDSVGYTFAYKQTDLGYNIIAVVIRGTPKTREWHGNVEIRDPSNTNKDMQDHFNFLTAKEELRLALGEYINDMAQHNPSLLNPAKNKFLVTGHSRGGAVANMLAADLANGRETFCRRENLFAYTFATPNVNKSGLTELSTYDCIINFVNAEDLVPYLPLNAWGYWKYGRTFVFPSQNVNPKYANSYQANLRSKYNGYNGYGKKGYSNTHNAVVSLSSIAPTVSDVYQTFYSTSSGLITPIQFLENLMDILSGMNQLGGINNFISYNLGPETEFLGVPIPGKPTPYSKLTKYLLEGVGVNLRLNPRIDEAHDHLLYLAWMQITNETDLRTDFSSYHVRVACPVDIDVYNSQGVLVGRIKNNIIDESIDSEVGVFVSEYDDVKNIFLPNYETYTFKMSGTDNGTMDFSVNNYTLASASMAQQKEFQNVTLFAGKTMTSTVGDSIMTTNVQLLVTNSNGTPIATVNTNGTETPISQNSQKQYFKLWGKTTRWEKTFLNWILLIVCFGWIWMAF